MTDLRSSVVSTKPKYLENGQYVLSCPTKEERKKTMPEISWPRKILLILILIGLLAFCLWVIREDNKEQRQRQKDEATAKTRVLHSWSVQLQLRKEGL